MSPTPLVSVVMSTYQGAAYVREAVDSILRQTLDDLELIVVDDGSTDATRAILQGYSDRRLRYEWRPHQGIGAAVNHGLGLARGPYVARMDADDVALPARLERQVAWLEGRPEVGILGTNVVLIDAAGETLGWSAYPEDDLRIRWTALLYNPFAQPTVVLRRAVLERHRLRYDESFAAAPDMELWSRLLKVTRGANLPDALVRYRVHDAQVSRTRREAQARNHMAVVERVVGELAPDLGLASAELRWLRRLVVSPAEMRDPLAWSVAKLTGARLAHAYLDLVDRFGRRHAGTDGLAWLLRRERRRLARRVLDWPRPRGWAGLYRRLAVAEPTLAGALLGHALGRGGRPGAAGTPPAGRAGGGGPEAAAKAARRRTILDVFTGARSTILVSGAARSGTTWVADLLNHDGAHRLVFEPFLPAQVPAARGFVHYQYAPEDWDDPGRVAAALAILRGRVRGRAVDRYNRRRVSTRRIVKDVRTNLMLGWLHRLLPEMRIVLVVRNPLAVALSRVGMGWETHLDALLGQPALLHDHPRVAEVAERLDPSSAFEQTVFLWSVLHYVPARQLRPGAVTAVCYEHLVLRPEAELRRLFGRLGLRFDPRVLDHVERASGTTTRRRNFRTLAGRSAAIAGFKRRLPLRELEGARRILAAFGLAGWYDEDGLPTSEIPFDGGGAPAGRRPEPWSGGSCPMPAAPTAGPR